MQIDLTKLLTNRVSTLHIDDSVTIPKDLFTDSRIDDLKNVTILGDIKYKEDDSLVLTAKLKGTMVLEDDLTLEQVDYEFDIDIEENLDKNQNILDITDVLWQNILVEVPSKVRKTDEMPELSGDGWRVISEDEYNEERNKANNPFQNLDELLKIKEDK